MNLVKCRGTPYWCITFFVRKYILKPLLTNVDNRSNFNSMMRQNIRLYSTLLLLLFLFQVPGLAQPLSPGGDTIRILAIGNSFSQDAVEYYLQPLAKAEGIQVIIGNLYMAGASLSQHLDNAQNNKPAYSFRKIDPSGEKVTTAKATLAMAVTDEIWDYISFQQTSSLSGKLETYEQSLPSLFQYVKERIRKPNTTFMLHQTWAYAQDSQHKGFSNYGRDQMNMYRAIVKTARRAKTIIPVEIVIPAGTAIQNGRTSFVGDRFCRDGYHLDEGIGRYTAACAWFEAVFKRSAVGNSFKPGTLSDKEAEVAQQAAHAAVKKPWKVTKLR